LFGSPAHASDAAPSAARTTTATAAGRRAAGLIESWPGNGSSAIRRSHPVELTLILHPLLLLLVELIPLARRLLRLVRLLFSPGPERHGARAE
jgi:hypothetical protein